MPPLRPAALLTATLTCVALSACGAPSKTAENADCAVTVRVFLAEDVTPAQRTGIEDELRDHDSVSEVEYRSSEEALREANEDARENPELGHVPDAKFPASFGVTVADGKSGEALVREMTVQPGVRDVRVTDGPPPGCTTAPQR